MKLESLCWPFNTLIQTGSKYGLDFRAEDIVIDSLGWNVVNDTLTLFTTSSFESAFPAIILVTVPPDGLRALFVSSPIAEVTVGSGLNVPMFTVASPFSSGNINMNDITVGTLAVQTSGLGQILVNGTITNATITASGVSNVYIIGLENYATVNLAGTANVYMKPANDNAVIVGQASGVNSVVFQMGRCFVVSPWLFGSVCRQSDSVSIPEIEPVWTCGLEVTGNFNCPAGGTFAAGKASLSGVLPLLNIPVLPENSPQERVVAGFPQIVNPSPISPFQVVSPPSPRPAFVASSTAAQFPGSTAGQGTMAAQAVSNPNLQGQNIGTYTFQGGNGGGVSQSTFGALGKRKLQQAFSNNNPTGASTNFPFGGALTAMNPTATFIQSYPCYYDNVGGYSALEIYPDFPYAGTIGKK
ncbi:g9900 [Coccomyxa elongata]